MSEALDTIGRWVEARHADVMRLPLRHIVLVDWEPYRIDDAIWSSASSTAAQQLADVVRGSSPPGTAVWATSTEYYQRMIDLVHDLARRLLVNSAGC